MLLSGSVETTIYKSAIKFTINMKYSANTLIGWDHSLEYYVFNFGTARRRKQMGDAVIENVKKIVKKMGMNWNERYTDVSSINPDASLSKIIPTIVILNIREDSIWTS